MRKVTPTYTLDWYVKWIASIIIIAAVICRSVPEISRTYDLVLSTMGTAGWLYVGLVWHDRAIILVNSIILFVLLGGLLRYMVYWL